MDGPRKLVLEASLLLWCPGCAKPPIRRRPIELASEKTEQVHPTGLVKPDDADAKLGLLAAEALETEFKFLAVGRPLAASSSERTVSYSQ